MARLCVKAIKGSVETNHVSECHISVCHVSVSHVPVCHVSVEIYGKQRKYRKIPNKDPPGYRPSRM